MRAIASILFGLAFIGPAFSYDVLFDVPIQARPNADFEWAKIYEIGSGFGGGQTSLVLFPDQTWVEYVYTDCSSELLTEGFYATNPDDYILFSSSGPTILRRIFRHGREFLNKFSWTPPDEPPLPNDLDSLSKVLPHRVPFRDSSVYLQPTTQRRFRVSNDPGIEANPRP